MKSPPIGWKLNKVRGSRVKLIQMGSMFFKKCPGCGDTKALTLFAVDSGKSDGRTSYCLECRRNYKKQHKASTTAHNRISAITYGPWKKVDRPNNCEVCGKLCKVVAHHSDYSKPYDVEWLCHSCHKRLHDILKTEESTHKMEIK